MAERRRTKKQQNTVKHFDYTLLTVVFFLLCIGLVMLFSVSSYDANLTFNDSTYYLKNQLKNTILGIIIMFVVMNIDYHRLDKLSFIAIVVSAVLIALVMTPLGYEANGARRWLNLGVSLQPAEVDKVGIINLPAAAGSHRLDGRGICIQRHGLCAAHAHGPPLYRHLLQAHQEFRLHQER